eukprot:7005181-Pyramimonas_sp.AAC.1
MRRPTTSDPDPLLDRMVRLQGLPVLLPVRAVDREVGRQALKELRVLAIALAGLRHAASAARVAAAAAAAAAVEQ